MLWNLSNTEVEGTNERSKGKYLICFIVLHSFMLEVVSYIKLYLHQLYMIL